MDLARSGRRSYVADELDPQAGALDQQEELPRVRGRRAPGVVRHEADLPHRARLQPKKTLPDSESRVRQHRRRDVDRADLRSGRAGGRVVVELLARVGVDAELLRSRSPRARRRRRARASCPSGSVTSAFRSADSQIGSFDVVVAVVDRDLLRRSGWPAAVRLGRRQRDVASKGTFSQPVGRE